jgi:cobaltochelatase CobS
MQPTMISLNTIEIFKNYNPSIKVPMWPSNSFCDPVDKFYAHRQEIAEAIGYYLMERFDGSTTDGLILEGPTGSGKSSAIRQFLAQLNFPVHTDVGTSNTEKEVLLGRLDPMEGILVFKDGPLTTAARHGHAFLFEERDCAPADINKGLNSVLDGYPIHLAESGDGERVELGKHFFFAATQNTAAGNDFSGECPAAQLQDASSEDRFEKIYVPYMEHEHEEAILENRFGNAIPLEIIQKTVKAANMCRSVYVGCRSTKPHPDLKAPTHQCGLAISTRGLLRFTRKVIQLKDLNSPEEMVKSALDRAFSLDKVTNSDKLFIEEVFLSSMLS